MNRRVAIDLVFSASLTVALALPAAAEEVRQGLNAPMILQLLSRPAEKPPDGSARYGTDNTSVSMMIRNPCPPGDFEHEVMLQRSLPGRGRK